MTYDGSGGGARLATASAVTIASGSRGIAHGIAPHVIRVAVVVTVPVSFRVSGCLPTITHHQCTCSSPNNTRPLPPFCNNQQLRWAKFSPCPPRPAATPCSTTRSSLCRIFALRYLFGLHAVLLLLTFGHSRSFRSTLSRSRASCSLRRRLPPFTPRSGSWSFPTICGACRNRSASLPPIGRTPAISVPSRPLPNPLSNLLTFAVFGFQDYRKSIVRITRTSSPSAWVCRPCKWQPVLWSCYPSLVLSLVIRFCFFGQDLFSFFFHRNRFVCLVACSRRLVRVCVRLPSFSRNVH